MAKNYLPIQFFEKRKDYDDRLTEGGGDSRPPKWVLSGEALTARSSQLVQGVESIRNAFIKRKKAEFKLPLVVCTILEENAIAKSHRSDVASLYTTRNQNRIHHNNILGFSKDRCLLSVVTDDDVFNTINQAVTNEEANAKMISSITSIEPFYPFVAGYDETIKYYKVRLVNYNNEDLNIVSKNLFELQCKNNGIEIAHKTKYASVQ
ncbi:MAG: hypothetical protein ACOXZ4_05305 [Sphaerochaetaceae bacterium]